MCIEREDRSVVKAAKVAPEDITKVRKQCSVETECRHRTMNFVRALKMGILQLTYTCVIA